jgi:hypothetical protein
MGLDVGLGAVSYPQTGEGRKRSQLEAELASYFGGESNADDQTRAGRSLDEAVRSFNETCWRFNRLSENVTLVASTSSYTLTTTAIRAPLRAVLVDSNSKDVDTIRYVPWKQVLDYDPQTISTGSAPQWYTFKNLHETGQVTYYPPLGATLTYPTVRHEYFRRIALEAGTSDVLEVPVEVEQAIFEWALWRLCLKIDKENAGAFGPGAQRARAAVEREWRDWPDIPALGVRG